MKYNKRQRDFAAKFISSRFFKYKDAMRILGKKTTGGTAKAIIAACRQQADLDSKQ